MKSRFSHVLPSPKGEVFVMMVLQHLSFGTGDAMCRS